MAEPSQITKDGAPLKANVPPATLDRVSGGPWNGAVQPPRGAYLHVPFCFHKCHYCDFYSIVDARDRREPFTDRLVAELHATGDRFTEPLEAIFVGGGTPTLLTADQWTRLLAAMQATLPGFPGCECTVEANPETVDAALLDTLVAGGVDRVSIGAQSFDRRHLETLERHHDPDAVVRAVGLARAAGLERVSLDLIFGIPGQRLEDWERDLDAVLALEPSHLSCYGLMYEPNTPLERKRALGRLESIDPDIEAAMYEMTTARLAAAGFEQYEISNWARPGERCRHNLLYWTGGSWWAFGPSAAGTMRDRTGFGGWRWRNRARLGDYLDVGPLPPVDDLERLDDETARGEAFMLGLRLTDGMTTAAIEALLDGDPHAATRRAVLAEGLADGRLEAAPDGVRFTAAGRLVADGLLSELVACSG